MVRDRGLALRRGFWVSGLGFEFAVWGFGFRVEVLGEGLGLVFVLVSVLGFVLVLVLGLRQCLLPDPRARCGPRTRV